MPKSQKKPTAKSSGKAKNRKQPVSKRSALIWLGRGILAVIMVSIPFYLSATREKAAIEFMLSSTHLSLQLNYNETQRLLDREVQMLSKSLDTKYLYSSYFNPFSLTAKPISNTNISKYQIDPLVKDRASLLMTTEHGFFSVMALTYKGMTRLEISASESALTFDFRPAPSADDPWNIYVDISLPDTFQLKPEECAVHLATSNKDSSAVAGLHTTQFMSAKTSPNVVLANSSDQLKLQIENSATSNAEILSNLDLSDFRTLRFDPIQRKNLPALLDGHYQFLNRDNTVEHKIATNSTVEVAADSLMLIELKLADRSLSSKFVGTFSSFKICHLGNCEEVIPSRLAIFGESKFVYPLSALYVIIFGGVVLGPTGLELIKKVLMN